jgi:hypothetical protein
MPQPIHHSLEINVDSWTTWNAATGQHESLNVHLDALDQRGYEVIAVVPKSRPGQAEVLLRLRRR